MYCRERRVLYVRYTSSSSRSNNSSIVFILLPTFFDEPVISLLFDLKIHKNLLEKSFYFPTYLLELHSAERKKIKEVATEYVKLYFTLPIT
jgi:hypothetical protein